MTTALARTPARLMLLAFGAACALHADRAPPWCVLAAGCGMLWFWLHTRGRLALPGPWARRLLTLSLLAGVMLSFGTLNGLAAGSALLMVMGALKLLELRSVRDTVVITTVTLILVLAAALDRQDLLRLPLYLATGWLALATIASIGSAAAAASAPLAFRRAGLNMLLAVPFAVLAFILVPRLPGALWSMPGSEQAQTGLSDEMSPGGISDLAVSDAIAFRVRFDDAVPAPAERYWRGPVLHDFDGNTWRNERGRSPLPYQPVEYLSPPLGYQVMLEAHHREWLFTLDTGRSLTGRRARQSAEGQFLAYRPVTQPTIYQAISHVRTRASGELSTTAQRRDTRLPAGRNPRTLELAGTLRAQAASDADYAALVMRYFGSNGFEYTLTPPQLDYNSVDDLLFNTRLGFCGHFASAFVTLMRAAGVPARVVTGYLGGTWNGIGGYYVVRQSDAHAWAEVWLEGQGWVRFDPTAMVAPERLQRGLNDLLPQARSATEALVQDTTWLRDLRDAWDAAGSWWRERVVNFNAGSQRDLLARLGLGDIDWRGMATLLLAGTVLWALLLLASLRRGRVHRDALGKLWERYLALLRRRGLAVAAHEGPEAIRRRAAGAWPQAAEAIERFTRGYAQQRFGAATPTAAAALPGLRRQLRAIARATAVRHPR